MNQNHLNNFKEGHIRIITAKFGQNSASSLGGDVCLFVFVALRPMSTAMVIAGRSVHITTLFPGQA